MATLAIENIVEKSSYGTGVTFYVTASNRNSVTISIERELYRSATFRIVAFYGGSGNPSTEVTKTMSGGSYTYQSPGASNWTITIEDPFQFGPLDTSEGRFSTIDVNAPNASPVVTIAPPAQLIVGNNTIKITASDPDGDPMTLTEFKYRSRLNSAASWSGYETISSGTAISGTVNITHNIPSSLMGYEIGYSATVRDSKSASTTATATGIVKTNVAPTPITGFTSPTPFRSERNNALSWTGASDVDGNLAGYKLERSIDLGATWTQIYQGAATGTTDRLDYNQAVNVQYRVKAYDSLGAESAWYTSAAIPVVNNRPPIAPPNIIVPLAIYSGEPVTTTWGASTDPENNLSGYTFERSVNGGTWEIVTNISALTYVDTAGTDWNTVAYRVKAWDTYGDESAYTTSPTRNVERNKAPVITCEITKLGSVKADITGILYSVRDPDGDPITVSEYVDSTLIRTYTASDGADQTLSLTGMAFMKVSNGSHSLKITATDSKGKSATHTITFTKEVYEAVVMLTPAQSLGTTLGVPIALAVMSIVAQFGDSEVEILATNNAKDTNPVWEDATTAFLSGNNYVFINKTIAKGNYYAFKITARRPASGGTGGYMSYMGGAFE